MPRTKPGELTDKQEVFCREYTNPKSKGFMNATQAYSKASPAAAPTTANVAGNKLRGMPKIQNRIAQLLEERGFGIDVRGDILRDIGKGRATRTETKVTKGGEVVEIPVYPTFSEQLRAIEIANKIDGTVESGRIAADSERSMMKELEKDILAEFRGERDVTPAGE